MPRKKVPFFRPAIAAGEINEVVATLRSGWLTSGPKVQQFERKFASAVGAKNAVAVNSATAALHLAVEAFGLLPGQGVLVPTMTFAATAEVVRYQGAIPILVDVDPATLNIDLADAERRLKAATAKVVGIMPVHVGGVMMSLQAISEFASKHHLWVVEDAAHAFPASWRKSKRSRWQHRTNGSRSISCYSFYANKTITTGEGGMAVTNNRALARRMKLMSLHGLSHDAWGRYDGAGSWDYRIVAPGFKYNLTDIAAAIGVHQISRAETLRREREQIARRYLRELNNEELELPTIEKSRKLSWHLFPIRLRLSRLRINRNEFMEELQRAGVGCSVHWRPLHLHPYYRKVFGYRPQDFPVATAEWKRLISLPIFPGMQEEEIVHVIDTVKRICIRNAR
ncbi:MAG TPA: DegT/DnrJ/EryC1/StrS family aminotransferase [Pyrinomonadaceae bacterium]|nr:DegT/DnrJ/EryC1/StrS family aminotransferase [Pyrinomonadaceae bacterium]